MRSLSKLVFVVLGILAARTLVRRPSISFGAHSKGCVALTLPLATSPLKAD
jgi:hypothetical protein